MIKAIEVYLVTNGQGLEAIEFYKTVFKAEVLSYRIFDDAMPDTPEETKNLVLNASLVLMVAVYSCLIMLLKVLMLLAQI